MGVGGAPFGVFVSGGDSVVVVGFHLGGVLLDDLNVSALLGIECVDDGCDDIVVGAGVNDDDGRGLAERLSL